MAGKLKSKPHTQKSVIKDFLENKTTSKESLIKDESFVISLKHLDRTQGESLYQWEEKGILAHAVDVLGGYCQRALRSQLSDKFTVYGAYPSKEKAGYFCPSYIPEDAEWGRIHVTGTQIIAGHVVGNTFYVVFLDPDHRFYKTELKHT